MTSSVQTRRGQRPGAGLPTSGTTALFFAKTNPIAWRGRLAGFLRIGLLWLAVPLSGQAQRAYVTQFFAERVSVINTATNAVIATVVVGNDPIDVAVSPDGSRVYVANRGADNVSVINASTTKVIATIDVGEAPRGLAVSPDGSRVYVANSGSDNVSVIDVASNLVVATIALANATPYAVALSPDGSRAYVVNYNLGTVSVIDTATNSVIATITGVGVQANALTVSPDGKRVYVLNFNSTTVSVIDTDNNAVSSTLVNVGNSPADLAVSPDGSRVYVTSSGSDQVLLINTATNAITAAIEVNDNPVGVAVSPDGSRVFVANLQDGNVSVIDASTNTVSATIPLGIVGPFSVATGIAPPCAAPTFGFSVGGPAGTTPASNAAGAVTLPLSLCAGSSSSFSGFSASATNVGLLETFSGDANVTYAGSPRAPRDLGVAASPDFFTGPYTLSSGSSGTLSQIFTPYSDCNADGNYDEGTDVLGAPITLTYTLTAPAFTADPSVSTAGIPCAGQTVSLTFDANDCLKANSNPFTAYLSDASGSFAAPVSLGVVTPGSPVWVAIPVGTPTGSGYRIQLTSTDPILTSSASNAFAVRGLTSNFNSNPTVSGVPACAGGSLRVSFTQQASPVCSFPLGNVFTAQLSDASGSFASPVTLGVVSPGINTLSIPQNTPGGSGYRVRIAATTNGSSAYSAVSSAFTVNVPGFASTPTVSGDNKCAGEALRLSFSVNTCAFPAGNTFRAELSNATGSFEMPVSVGIVSAGALNNVVIPSGTPAGMGYKIRVVSSSPEVFSAGSANFRVRACGNSREAAPEGTGLHVRVSPNPSPEGALRIAVTGAESQALRVTLFNAVGQPVREQGVPKASEEAVLDWDISRQPAGLYLLRVSSETESKTVKVVH